MQNTNKNLVIVESPAKAKTIEKYLGSDYKVLSSYGHIRDLKDKGLGIEIENNYKPVYIIPEDKATVVKSLKKEAKNAPMVWLASDEDREGEAIAWHLFEALELKKEHTKRIVFHEITKDAILNAIEHPRDIDYHLVDAQQARRVLDRIVGFELSPVLWKKIRPSLSAGRVQSVAVRLIVEREREINAFRVEVSYKVIAEFKLADGTILKAELARKKKHRHCWRNSKRQFSKYKISKRSRPKNLRRRHLPLPPCNRKPHGKWDIPFRKPCRSPKSYMNRERLLICVPTP